VRLRIPLSTLTALLVAQVAHANPTVSVHLEAAAARPTDGAKADQFGWGGLASVSPELALHRVIGLELCVGAVAMSPGDDASRPPGVAASDVGVAGFSTVGTRVRPLATLVGETPSATFDADGLWLSGGVGAGLTGELVRPAMRAALGFDAMTDDFAAGPFVGYVHMVEPDGGSVRPEDARIAIFGLHGSLLPASRAGQVTEEDPDRDGIAGARDACPLEPEDRDGFEDGDGCPDLDNDGDAIFDVDDQCDDAPEDFDHHADEDGCPDLDNDRDEVLDVDDLCPNDPEDRDGFQDEDGCPDTDADQDGVPDAFDRCPGDLETPNGIDDGDGCPDDAGVAATATHIVTDEHIRFASDQKDLTPDGDELVRKVASFLLLHPEYELIQIRGHADDLGEEEYNLRLSAGRALSVRARLVALGVPDKRLFVGAFGEKRPVTRGYSSDDRAKNRRVEFEILRRTTRQSP
jgi:outer membrane protein OmpA-like peptidoglycan-associated protein